MSPTGFTMYIFITALYNCFTSEYIYIYKTYKYKTSQVQLKIKYKLESVCGVLLASLNPPAPRQQQTDLKRKEEGKG